MVEMVEVNRGELISIIVPIYRVECYLPKCLESLIAQSYHNIEIVLVDDGSPDNSGVICDEYAARDSRIKVFHIPNGGVAKARQLGVESSAGEYIVFVDPDDWMATDAIEAMYGYMESGISIVASSHVEISEGGERSYIYNRELCDREEYIQRVLLAAINVSPWGKLYRRGLFNEDSFPAFRRGQDKLMNIKISVDVDRVLFIPEVTNFYLCSRVDSTTNNTIIPLEEKLEMMRYVYSVFESRGEAEVFELPLAMYSLSLYIFAIGNGQRVGREVYRDTLNILGRYRLPMAYRIMAMVVRSRLLQSCYYHFRRAVASNTAIRHFMFKLR